MSIYQLIRVILNHEKLIIDSTIKNKKEQRTIGKHRQRET